VDAAELSGRPAELLEPALGRFAAAEEGRHAIALPLFFGPSGALVDYLPPRLQELRKQFPSCTFSLAACLESAEDDSAGLLAAELACASQRTAEDAGFKRPAIIVTDHGSPLATVTAVRDRIGSAWPNIPQMKWGPVQVASMERREGEAYVFNEPLLATALAELANLGNHEVIVALQFLFAGRHAGPDGDIANILATARQACPDLRVVTTPPIGESDTVLELLARRFREVIQ
jgi:sirohydrochlorin ferrochelatase